MTEIEHIQSRYEQLINSGKVTKKNICDLLIPFRNKHNLTDNETLQLARKELTKSQIYNLFEKSALSNAKHTTPYKIVYGNVTLSVWWYMQPNNKLMILMQLNEYNYEKTVKFSLAQLNNGYKALQWLEETQSVDRSGFKYIKQEILIAISDSDYRLDNLDLKGYGGN